MSLRAVFFDLDGTLLDTAPSLAKALNRLLEKNGRNPFPLSKIRSVVSDGAYALLQLGFGLDRNHPNTQEMRQVLLDYYAKDLSSDTTVFPGIAPLIASLSEHGISWGIVTNKPDVYAEPLMQDFEFASSPTCLICPEHVNERKPDPESLFLACESARCSPSEAIYVGDHRRDIECGKNAGMTTISVDYGYISPGESSLSWGANHNVQHADELWPIIKTYL